MALDAVTKDSGHYVFIAFLCDNLFEKCDILEENLVFCLDKMKLMGFTPEKTQKLWDFML